MIANRFFNAVGKRMLQSSSSCLRARPVASASAVFGSSFHSPAGDAGKNISRRSFSFNFAGPRKLDDILKKELVMDKSAVEVADIWYTYHEEKANVHGIVLQNNEGKNLLDRAKDTPFFVQPVFRDNGYFMLISQFQDPCHFLMAYLEDFKMDPAAAQPLLTFSVFDDFAESKDILLVRVDVLNKGIGDSEGLKIVQSILDGYTHDDEYTAVTAFNKTPDSFDLDDYISRQNEKWRREKEVDVDN